MKGLILFVLLIVSPYILAKNVTITYDSTCIGNDDCYVVENPTIDIDGFSNPALIKSYDYGAGPKHASKTICYGADQGEPALITYKLLTKEQKVYGFNVGSLGKGLMWSKRTGSSQITKVMCNRKD